VNVLDRRLAEGYMIKSHNRKWSGDEIIVWTGKLTGVQQILVFLQHLVPMEPCSYTDALSSHSIGTKKKHINYWKI